MEKGTSALGELGTFQTTCSFSLSPRKCFTSTTKLPMGSISGLIVVNVLSGVFISRHYEPSVGPPDETQIQQLYTKPYGTALINIFIFLEHSAWKDYASYLEEGESPHGDWEHYNRYLWFGFHRILFILGLSCILLPILLGHGTLVFKFLSASVWTPLARISFATDVLTACICSFAAGLPISLMVESPFMGLKGYCCLPKSNNLSF